MGRVFDCVPDEESSGRRRIGGRNHVRHRRGGRGYVGRGRLYLLGSFLERGLVAGLAKRRKERDSDFSRSGTQGTGASLSVTGPPVQVVHEVLTNPDDGYGGMAVARSGNLVYVRGPERTDRGASTRLVWVSREGKELIASQTVSAYEDMTIAPDQKMAA